MYEYYLFITVFYSVVRVKWYFVPPCITMKTVFCSAGFSRTERISRRSSPVLHTVSWSTCKSRLLSLGSVLCHCWSCSRWRQFYFIVYIKYYTIYLYWNYSAVTVNSLRYLLCRTGTGWWCDVTWQQVQAVLTQAQRFELGSVLQYLYYCSTSTTAVLFSWSKNFPSL